MLKKSDIIDAIDAGSREITNEYSHLSAHIAHSGSMIKTEIRNRMFPNGNGNRSLDSIAQLFDVCHIINTTDNVDIDSEIEHDVQRIRAASLHSLIELFYNNRAHEKKEVTTEDTNERFMAQHVGAELPHIRHALPTSGFFGPEWITTHTRTEFQDAMTEFIYDIDAAHDDWDTLKALLPTDLQDRFDSSLLPMEVPQKIQSAEHAKELLSEIARRANLTLEEFTDPSKLGVHMEQYPIYKMIIEFFAQESRRK